MRMMNFDSHPLKGNLLDNKIPQIKINHSFKSRLLGEAEETKE